jgi:hypothetical protein
MLTVTTRSGHTGPPSQALEWKEFPHAHQSLSVAVSAMELSVVPTLAGQRWGQWGLRFEGTTDGEPRKGLPVAGAIELLDPGEQLGLLFDQWKNPPKEFEGYGFLVHDHESPAAAFRFSLYCKAEAFDWIYRAFASGLASLHGGWGSRSRSRFRIASSPTSGATSGAMKGGTSLRGRSSLAWNARSRPGIALRAGMPSRGRRLSDRLGKDGWRTLPGTSGARGIACMCKSEKNGIERRAQFKSRAPHSNR